MDADDDSFDCDEQGTSTSTHVQSTNIVISAVSTEVPACSLTKAVSTVVEGTPEKTPRKRSGAISISPIKSVKIKKVGSGAPIQTFIFFDFETTGCFKPSPLNNQNSSLRDPHDFSGELNKKILNTQKDEFPQITEMSFISIPRKSYERGIREMAQKSKFSPHDDSSLRHRLACNVHTRQVDPRLTTNQWREYEEKRARNAVFVHDMESLREKNTFDKEWPAVRAFLDQCPKPACLIAHNGLDFDFRVLYGELSRYGFLDKEETVIPEGVVFADSLLAIRELDSMHRDQIYSTTKAIDWTTVSTHIRAQTGEEAKPTEPAGAAANGYAAAVATIHKEGDDWLDSSKPPAFAQRTPPRPIPSAKPVTEPKSVHRRLFGRGNERDDDCESLDHPLRFLNKKDWSPAKRRRIQHRFFKRVAPDHWEFSRDDCKFGSSCKLEQLYKIVIRGQYDAHFAQDDSEALLQVCLSYGPELLSYFDQKAADFPF